MQLTREDLWSLEAYSVEREAFRRAVLEHKSNRRIALGEHFLLLFEDQMTIRYQVQEMLRIERVFEAAAIQDELDAYNPLIPDGRNWKCTFLIAYDNPDERHIRLEALVGVEDRIWVQVGEGDRVFGIADEDLDRSRENKTSSVHFLRFELTGSMIDAARAGATLRAGIDHPAAGVDDVTPGSEVAPALAEDLTGVDA